MTLMAIAIIAVYFTYVILHDFPLTFRVGDNCRDVYKELREYMHNNRDFVLIEFKEEIPNTDFSKEVFCGKRYFLFTKELTIRFTDDGKIGTIHTAYSF